MIGRTIGKYRILEKLGRGGMGTVYKAVDETLNREVAVKVLNPDLGDTEVMKRFQAEARALAKLSHPEIATIHEIHRSDNDLLMVMEFVRGETLEQLLARSGVLPPERAAYLVAQILGALAHAHKAGVVHRDLKPSNVMVTEYGGVKIMDFGIARVAGAEHMTAVGFMVGTPAYMSPERILGNEVDGRADLYSVGVLFYRLLTGQLPFSAANPTDMVQKQLSEAPTPARTYRADLPEWCEELLTRALAKSPADRFQSADDFRAGLLSAITSASNEQTGLYVQPDAASWAPASPDALTIATAVPASTGGSELRGDPAASMTDAALAATIVSAAHTASPLASAGTVAATETPPASAAIPVPSTDVAPAPAVPPTSPDGPPSSDADRMDATGPVAATLPAASPKESDSGVRAPQPPAPAAGTVVMKKQQFAVAGALLGALALGVVALGVVVWRRSSAPETAQSAASSASESASRSTTAGSAASPSAPETPAPLSPTVPPATAPPLELSDPPPIPVGTPAPPPPSSPPATASAVAAPRPPRPAPAASGSASRPGATPAPAAPAVPTAPDGKPLVTSPFTFEAKAIVLDGDRGRERDAKVLVADGKVTVSESAEKVLYVVPVSTLTSLTFSNSRQPLWNSPNGPAEAMRVESGAFGFLKGGRNWVGLRTADSLLVLRVEDGVVRRVITALQERTGLTVARLVEPKE